MLKIENTEVSCIYAAIRAMRNPLNSWAKSDTTQEMAERGDVGENDWGLMKRLCSGGSAHRKFMRQIIVTVDFTAPMYWWKEFDAYKVGTVRNSCSTMHKIQAAPIDRSMFSTEHLYEDSLKALDEYLKVIEKYRVRFNETKNKEDWWQIIQLLPSSHEQRATLTLNYEMLHNAYHSRKGHKQDEWSKTFIQWCESLPLAELIIME